jgi:AcrR family transcriptional regulator
MSPVQRRWNRLDPDTRRAEILAGARRLFTTRPYAAVSVTAIAQEAGVSRALVTHYFGGKRELFLEVLRGWADLGRIVPRTDLDLPIEETVARNVRQWLAFMEDNRDLVFTIAAGTALDRDPEVAELIDAMRDGIVERMLANHFRDGNEPPPAARIVLRAYTGMAQVAVFDWLAAGRSTRAQVEALMTAGLLAAVRQVLPAVMRADAATAVAELPTLLGDD